MKILILLMLASYSMAISQRNRLSRKMNATEIESYLYGGRNAMNGEVPWQVAIQVPEMPDFLCGGSIIGDKWILTAAYCGLFETGLKVRYNTLKLSGGSQIDVKKDLQLTFSGWDTNPHADDPPFLDDLQVANFTSVTNERCMKKITDLDPGNACALARKDVCTTTGDHGGPAVNITDSPPTLYGIIITHQLTCHDPITETDDYFEVLTFVSYYRMWIDAIMKASYSLAIKQQNRLSKKLNSLEIESYLAGKRKATEGEAPWQVAVQIPDISYYLCGGSIIGTKWVLTAAYCSSGIFENSIQYIEIKWWIADGCKKSNPHPNYDYNKHKADISVLELPNELELNKPNCKKIDLPQQMLTPTEGLPLTFSGWDDNPHADDPPFLDDLLIANFTSVTNERCKKKIPNLDDGNACALAQRDICTTHGDHGGPAVNITDSPKTLYGVILNSQSTCHEPISDTNDFFEELTFVSYYRMWIDTIMQVRYNTLKLSGGSQMDVKKATPHTKFNAAKLQADISVLELTGSLPTDKINCKIIALPQSDLKPTEGLELTFSGWDTNPEGDPPFLDNLQVTNFTSVTNDRCKKKITDLDDGNACALAKKDICTTSGDRGGPAANITDTPITLYGIIITHEKTCHEPVSPTNDFFEVMTFVSYYKWWIDAIMQGLVPTTEAPTK
ncbi:hypothetical protein BLOT_012333 [Blomia tropicalis]|nr:hypothetical protein BLOT_012333 [Blomia tropicalis]